MIESVYVCVSLVDFVWRWTVFNLPISGLTLIVLQQSASSSAICFPSPHLYLDLIMIRINVFCRGYNSYLAHSFSTLKILLITFFPICSSSLNHIDTAKEHHLQFSRLSSGWLYYMYMTLLVNKLIWIIIKHPQVWRMLQCIISHHMLLNDVIEWLWSAHPKPGIKWEHHHYFNNFIETTKSDERPHLLCIICINILSSTS